MKNTMHHNPLERRSHCSGPSLPVINAERIKAAKSLVEKAVKLRKVFSILGPYPVIRAGLLARGWVERRLRRPHQRVIHSYAGDEDDDGEDGDDNNACITERVEDGEKEEDISDMYDLMSRLVRNETIYFYWTTRRDSIDCHSLQKDQIINHYANACCFTTKVGLCLNLRNLHWFDAANPDTFFPRCYKLGAQDDKEAFIEDFRRTACTNLLQYVVESSVVDSGDKLKEKNFALEGRKRPRKLIRNQCVGPGVIDTALRVCEEFLSSLEHSDIDVPIENSSLSKQHWDEFLQDYYLVVHDGVLIQGANDFVKRCQDMVTRLQKVCPQLDTDGTRNIWIIKPGAMSRGRGIMCMNRLDEILTLVANDATFIKDSKWVVQKYLERPLLVHGTKFDIRQWFLVTDWNPLTIWFYRECYLRFSTQPYSTRTLDSAVHLCNNSIQKHFQPSQNRHPCLPGDNMWSCSDFQAYLRAQGRGTEWATAVVPGMRQAVVHALQTAQDLVEGRKASFELYGADFVLGSDLRPWLLEINTSPTMACSTAVTARLCPAVQLDTLRVVLDQRLDTGAHTGGFQLIYKQAPFGVPHYVGMNLLVEGAQIRRARTLANRKAVASKHTIQLPPDQPPSGQPDSTDKPSRQRPHTRRRSAKKTQCDGEKKRQQPSPTSGFERREKTRESDVAPRAEGLLVLQPEPQKKAPRLEALSLAKAALLPRSLTSSFWTVPDIRPQSDPIQGPQRSRLYANQIALQLQCRAPFRGLPSLSGPLPVLEVLRLQPNPVPGSLSTHAVTFSCHPSLYGQSKYRADAPVGPKADTLGC